MGTKFMGDLHAFLKANKNECHVNKTFLKNPQLIRRATSLHHGFYFLFFIYFFPKWFWWSQKLSDIFPKENQS
jgi:hypothetical protein